MKATEKLSIYRYEGFGKPCAVFTTNYTYNKEKMVNAGYHKIWNLNNIAVFTHTKNN
jgi:hypothetical protein